MNSKLELFARVQGLEIPRKLFLWTMHFIQWGIWEIFTLNAQKSKTPNCKYILIVKGLPSPTDLSHKFYIPMRNIK